MANRSILETPKGLGQSGKLQPDPQSYITNLAFAKVS